MTTIRLANSEDLSKIQELNTALFEFESGRDPGLDLSWPHGEEGKDYFVKAILGDKDEHVCFVAEEGELIVGYVIGGIKEPDTTRPGLTAELENIYIAEEFRSQGVGTQLVDAFLEWCKQKEVVYVWVEAYAANDSAVAFYKQRGFKDYTVVLEQKLR